jgi:hypothetical protein
MLAEAMADEPRSGDEWPPPLPPTPSAGDDIMREVERLKQEPAKFGCFGMSFGMLLAVLALAALAWWLLR